MPVIALAASPSPTTSTSVAPTPAEGIAPTGSGKTIPNPLGTHDLQYVVTQVFNLAFGLAGLVALIYLIIGGYQYITSSGNPDAAETAKGTIVNSIIGLIIVLTSFLLVNFTLRQIGAGGW